MAFDFIKKVFSFGRKKVEETGPEEQGPVGVQPETTPLPEEAAPPPDFLRRDDAPPTEKPHDVAPSEAAVTSVAPTGLAPEPSELKPSPEVAPPVDRTQKTVAEPEPAPAPHPLPDLVPASEKKDEAATPAPPSPRPSREEGKGEGPGPDRPAVPSQPVAPVEEPPALEAAIETPDEPEAPPPEPQAPAPQSPLDREGRTEGPERGDEPGPAREAALPEAIATEPTPASPLREDRAEGAGGGGAVTPPTPALRVDPPLKGDGNAGKVTVARKVEQKTEAVTPPTPEPRIPWYQRLRQGLARSSKELTGNISGIFTKRRLDEDTLQDLEDVLLRADLGMETAIRITDALASGRYGKSVSDEEVRTIMAQEVEKVLTPVALPLELDLSVKPHVILVVGVNGTGKTTTIGKLAAKLAEGGLSVTLAAGDTFRAAAIEQLSIWGERTGSPVVSSKLGAAAAGLAYDAFQKARAAGSDVLIIDTAGRLQNKTELMAELEKIVRVLGKLDPEAPHTVLQTVDATTGQNALNQVEIFRNVAGVNGLVMTKLDGTARGGILVAIAARHKLPVYFIGVGEQVDDLEPFSAGDFAKAIAGVE
jgi:fused signal recognition particle receptor